MYRKEKGVSDAEEAIAGARDIIAEQIIRRCEVTVPVSENTDARRQGMLSMQRQRTRRTESVYETYYDFHGPADPRLAGHQILAVEPRRKGKVH